MNKTRRYPSCNFLVCKKGEQDGFSVPKGTQLQNTWRKHLVFLIQNVFVLVPIGFKGTHFSNINARVFGYIMGGFLVFARGFIVQNGGFFGTMGGGGILHREFFRRENFAPGLFRTVG